MIVTPSPRSAAKPGCRPAMARSLVAGSGDPAPVPLEKPILAATIALAGLWMGLLVWLGSDSLAPHGPDPAPAGMSSPAASVR